MAQFLYPISDVTNTFASGGFADIDEASPSDTDFAYGTNNATNTLECALTATGITDPASSTGHTVYWRQSQADSDDSPFAPSTGGSNATYDVLLIQGTTTIATCASGSSTNDGSFAAGSYTLTAGEADSITDYTDLRIRMVSIGTGGTPSGRRAAAFSSAYLEIPDAPAGVNLVVQESSHAHSAEQPTITHDYTLTVQDASHAHAADNVSVTIPPPLDSNTNTEEVTTPLGFNSISTDNFAGYQQNNGLNSILGATYSILTGLTTGYEGTTTAIRISPDGTHTGDRMSAFWTLTAGTTYDYAILMRANSSGTAQATNYASIGITPSNITHTTSNSGWTLFTGEFTTKDSGTYPGHIQIDLFADNTDSGATSDYIISIKQKVASINLVVQDSLHAHTADSPTITHDYSITSNEASHAHAADNVTVTHSYSLTVQESSHTHTADNVDVTHSYSIVPEDGTHAHNADQPTITHDYSVTSQESLHAHTADNVTLDLSVNLVPEDGTHAHTADQPTITHDYTVTSQESSHAHVADNVDITTSYSLTANESSHAHTADEPVITHSYTLVVQDSLHGHTAEAPTPTTAYSITANESLHGHTADNVTITLPGVVNLVVQDASHGHTADNVVVTTSYSITVNDASHGHTADQPTITHDYSAASNEALHAHIADNVIVSYTPAGIIVQDSSHGHTADNVDITHSYTLAVNEASHAHTADPVVIVVNYTVPADSTTHNHLSDNAIITSAYLLVSEDTLHTHTADNVDITLPSALAYPLSMATAVKRYGKIGPTSAVFKVGVVRVWDGNNWTLGRAKVWTPSGWALV